MKYFTEREFSGIFSLAGGEFCVFEKGIPGGPGDECHRLLFASGLLLDKMQ